MQQKLSKALIAIALIPAFAGLSLHDARAKNKDVGAAIAAGLVGLAVGAAVAKHARHHSDVYYPDYQPPYPPGGYNNYWGSVRSPQPGVVCYDAQRACYSDGGDGFSRKWTIRFYGG